MVIDERAEREYLKQFDRSPEARRRYEDAKADHALALRIHRAAAEGLLPGVTEEEARAKLFAADSELDTARWLCDA